MSACVLSIAVCCDFFTFFVVVQIAGKVAAPLGKTNEIVILSGEGSRMTGEVTRLLAELPVTVNALTGVDLSKVKHTRSKGVIDHYVRSKFSVIIINSL